MKKQTEEALQASIIKFFTNEYCLKHHTPRLLIFSVRNEGSSVSVKVLKALCYQILKDPRASGSLVKKILDHLTGNAIGGAIARSLGVLPGVSDLIVLLPNKTLFIELKLPNGRQSDSQKEFEQRVQDLGFEYYLIRSLEEFKILIKSKL